MELVLTIGALLLLLLLGVWGLWRGVRRGLLAIMGTLLGAVLVDLWGTAWGEWVRAQFRPESPAPLTLLVVALAFLAVAFIIGYGSGVLLPRPDPKARMPARMEWGDRLVGGLIGALNGTLIVSYLLRYATELLRTSDFGATVESAPILRVLYNWLPWFVAATVLTLGFWIVVRLAMRVAQLATRPGPKSTPPQSAAAQASPQQAANMQEISSKIDQALNDPPRKQ